MFAVYLIQPRERGNDFLSSYNLKLYKYSVTYEPCASKMVVNVPNVRKVWMVTAKEHAIRKFEQR
jgi:hypothetical protein